MHRGYIKFWRKAEDSQSWSRGLEYRGLMISILQRAVWKAGYSGGEQVEPGQFTIGLLSWSEELGVSRPVLLRMLDKLSADGFIQKQNVNNRFSRISVINWRYYQTEETASRTTNEQPSNNRRTSKEQLPCDHGTTGEQPADTLKEYKKEKKKEEKPGSEIPEDSATHTGGVPQRHLPRQQIQAARYPAPNYQPPSYFSEQCQEGQAGGKAPYPGLYPSRQPRPANFAQQQAQQRHDLASFALAANQELQNGLKTSHSSENSRSGGDLPPQHERGGVPGALHRIPRESAGFE